MTLDSLDVVILVGGIGSRLRSVVSDRPKCLAIVSGRPFLTFLLDQLIDQKINRVILGTGFLADQLQQTFGDRYGTISILYSREESPLGTGGGLRLAARLCQTQHVLVMNGDSYFDFDLHDFVERFNPETARLGMALAWMKECGRYGQVNLSEDGTVVGFLEKATTTGPGWINAGIYLIDKHSIESFCEVQKPFSLERDFFPKQIGKGFFGRVYEGAFIDIGTPESYRAAEVFFARYG